MSDEERREVAARLSSANEHSCSPDCELRYALDGSYDCKGNGCTGCRRDAFDRLAGLIYPGDTSLSCRDIVACDRDALLELADKARKLGDEENGPASFAVRCTFRVFARNIYKALGVGE